MASERPDLAAFAAHLDLLEAALDAGDVEALAVLRWPAAEGVLRPDERGQAEALLRRIAAAERRVESALGDVRTQLDDVTARRHAARAYTLPGDGAQGAPA